MFSLALCKIGKCSDLVGKQVTLHSCCTFLKTSTTVEALNEKTKANKVAVLIALLYYTSGTWQKWLSF